MVEISEEPLSMSQDQNAIPNALKNGDEHSTQGKYNLSIPAVAGACSISAVAVSSVLPICRADQSSAA